MNEQFYEYVSLVLKGRAEKVIEQGNYRVGGIDKYDVVEAKVLGKHIMCRLNVPSLREATASYAKHGYGPMIYGEGTVIVDGEEFNTTEIDFIEYKLPDDLMSVEEFVEILTNQGAKVQIVEMVEGMTESLFWLYDTDDNSPYTRAKVKAILESEFVREVALAIEATYPEFDVYDDSLDSIITTNIFGLDEKKSLYKLREI